MRPLDDDIFPDKSFWENLKSKFSDITDKVKDFFKDKFGLMESENVEGRTLLEDAKVEVVLEAADNGASVAAYGTSSGVDAAE